ncbi:MAG: hypothetical protein CM15mP130_1040 [Verrucomicrobiota bacterium]|nr:MAG: hypothetical protein CM15mP130_1040 [Verrucomicrobiota bacterium]
MKEHSKFHLHCLSISTVPFPGLLRDLKREFPFLIFQKKLVVFLEVKIRFLNLKGNTPQGNHFEFCSSGGGEGKTRFWVKKTKSHGFPPKKFPKGCWVSKSGMVDPLNWYPSGAPFRKYTRCPPNPHCFFPEPGFLAGLYLVENNRCRGEGGVATGFPRKTPPSPRTR